MKKSKLCFFRTLTHTHGRLLWRPFLALCGCWWLINFSAVCRSTRRRIIKANDNSYLDGAHSRLEAVQESAKRHRWILPPPLFIRKSDWQ
jgi:hypothetical protein